MDLSFDAHAYASIAGVEPSLRGVTRRVAANLGEAAAVLRLPVNRLALRVTAEVSQEVFSDPVALVAGRFFKDSVAASRPAELSARTNLRSELQLNGLDKAVLANKLQHVHAVLVGTDTSPARVLRIEAEVNTAPEATEVASFLPTSIQHFYTQASAILVDCLDEYRRVESPKKSEPGHGN
jgi:hypothetical protein